MPDKSVDLVLTDPPYGISINKMSFTKNEKVVKNALCNSTDYRGMAEWDTERIAKEYFVEMFRISKNQIIFGGNYYTDMLPPTNGWIIWDKITNIKYRNLFADCELAWCSKGVARIYPWLWKGMIQENMKNKDRRIYPTQKPVGLFCNLLMDFTKETDLVFDPFMGSGTTGVSCANLGRRFVGCEINPKSFEIAKKRIEAARAQTRLF